MVMQNARNNPALRRIKAAMNSKIYMGALRVMNEEGEEACRRYMGQFFNAERREESLRELFGKSLTPDAHVKSLRVKYGKAAQPCPCGDPNCPNPGDCDAMCHGDEGY